jgi:hypothetical protein
VIDGVGGHQVIGGGVVALAEDFLIKPAGSFGVGVHLVVHRSPPSGLVPVTARARQARIVAQPSE